MDKKKVILCLLFIILLGAFLRFYQITEIPLGLYPDEAMNGNNALEALATGGFKVFYPENNGREGLFINIQALSLWFFGNEPWALRLVSAFFGTLTVLGIFLLTKELLGGKSPSEAIALLSSFFLASSYWHINFSRIGFRAIMVPFLATFAMYFLLKGLRSGKISFLVAAGIFTGLGLHTYIAFRFMPFVLAVPILWYLWSWWKGIDAHIRMGANYTNTKCTPCAAFLFLFITFMAVLPIGWYFFQNPQDFIGRAGDVSIFSAESPLPEFVKSNVATLGMFFWRGDCNWRHNLACQPALHPLIAFFFLMGLIVAGGGLLKSKVANRPPFPKRILSLNFRNLNLFGTWDLGFGILLAWLFLQSLPATLTKEGLPHALRSIGMIPPVMMLSAIGAWRIYRKVLDWFDIQKFKWPLYANQLERIRREVIILFLLILALVPLNTYRQYFISWAHNPQTYGAFSTDLLHLGRFLKELPQEVKKYVVVNLPGVEVRGIPMPSQTVMFGTDTFREEERLKKNAMYILPDQLDQFSLAPGGKTVIAFLNGEDRALINSLKQRFTEFKVKVPGDFVILQNY